MKKKKSKEVSSESKPVENTPTVSSVKTNRFSLQKKHLPLVAGVFVLLLIVAGAVLVVMKKNDNNLTADGKSKDTQSIAQTANLSYEKTAGIESVTAEEKAKVYETSTTYWLSKNDCYQADASATDIAKTYIDEEKFDAAKDVLNKVDAACGDKAPNVKQLKKTAGF